MINSSVRSITILWMIILVSLYIFHVVFFSLFFLENMKREWFLKNKGAIIKMLIDIYQILKRYKLNYIILFRCEISKLTSIWTICHQTLETWATISIPLTSPLHKGSVCSSANRLIISTNRNPIHGTMKRSSCLNRQLESGNIVR